MTNPEHVAILDRIAKAVVREHRLHGNQPTNVPVPAPLTVITEHWPSDAPDHDHLPTQTACFLCNARLASVDPSWDYTLPERFRG
jgi:hypothetical protein